MNIGSGGFIDFGSPDLAFCEGREFSVVNEKARRLFGLSVLALGLVGLLWDHFIKPWQPMPDGVPGLAGSAYASALLTAGSGLGLQWTKTSRVAGVALTVLLGAFALIWLDRALADPRVVANWSGAAEAVTLVLGAILATISAWRPYGEIRRRLILICRAVFGCCLLAFGVAHFVYSRETAAMAPAWLLLPQGAWANLTGVAHLAAGAALLTGIRARLAAALVTVMFAGFELLVWAPMLVSSPGVQSSWGGNAVNIGLTASALLMFAALQGSDRAAADRGSIPGLRRELDLGADVTVS